MVFWVFVAGFFLYPTQASEFAATNTAFYLLNIPIALGLALMWGYCGILSFGQVAYFGIAGYAYGIIAGNMAMNPWGPTLGVLGGLGACGGGRRDLRLFRVLRAGADVDRADPDPGY